jgi:hypothetical protein
MPLAYCLISELHIETNDSELRLVAALRHAARERGARLSNSG